MGFDRQITFHVTVDDETGKPRRSRYNRPVVQTVYPLTYTDAGGETHLLPHNTRTDFHTMPVWVRVFRPPVLWFPRAAALHAFLYKDEGFADRKQADSIFREACQSDGVGLVFRNLLYWSVRVFGKRLWTKL